MSMIRKFSVHEQKAVDEKARTIKHVISTAAPDRDGDVVTLDGWDTREFMENPVVLFGHRHDRPPIAKCLSLERTERGLEAETQFPPKGVDEFADKVFELHRSGFLKAWSVGFMPRKWSPRVGEDGERMGVIFEEKQLLEYSSVPIPANPEAVNLAISKGVMTAADAEALGFNAAKGCVICSVASAFAEGAEHKLNDDVLSVKHGAEEHDNFMLRFYAAAECLRVEGSLRFAGEAPVRPGRT